MAQCDLSLSYDPCKTDYSYQSWCSSCSNRESARRRSKSECIEPYKRKGREPYNGKIYDSAECENIKFDSDSNCCMYRLESARIRTNLCELPTTYITNNCQATTRCSDLSDPMIEKQKKYPKFDRLNIGRFDNLRPHYPPPQHHEVPSASKFKSSKEDFPSIYNKNSISYFPLEHDTNTIFDGKIDLSSLKDRYVREMDALQRNIKELKRYPEISPPKIPLGDSPKKREERVNVSPSSSMKIRLKRSSKTALKTKSKYGNVKVKKARQKFSCPPIEVTNSECSDSEDSNREEAYEDETDLSESSSLNSLPLPNQECLIDISDWPLRPSLFPNVPPYLKFVRNDSIEKLSMPFGNQYLKWKLSVVTPVLVRKTLVNSGFKLVRSSNEWMGTWGKHMKSPLFKTLKDYQKINHFPGTFHLGRKDRLWRNMQRMMFTHGHKEFGFIPTTYVLPQDFKLLKQNWNVPEGGTTQKYIIKPPASARGTGIRVINRWWQLPKRMSLVVQEYITNPYLINGSKFDLRLYVLVTSFNPLRMYLYPDGLARFASVPYDHDENNLKNQFMHLTNYSINKLSSSYATNKDANSCEGHKWTLSKLWEYMSARGVDTKSLWKNLEQLVIKTIISCESSIVTLCKENLANRYNCYELFGVDVLLDHRLKPWLLEVNISPSLHSQSPLDEYVKAPMVEALFNLAQFHLPPRLARSNPKQSPNCYDPRLYTTALSKSERYKHNFYQECKDREEYLNAILNDLTGDDIRQLIQAEDELTVLGPFERIFPTSNTYKYSHFLEPRYYNRLFDAWEHKYHENRPAGIKLLQNLCKQRLHLQVAPLGNVTKNSSSTIRSDQKMLLPSREGQTYHGHKSKGAAKEVEKLSSMPTPNRTDGKTLFGAMQHAKCEENQFLTHV